MYDENGNPMALLNHLINVKDSRWLQVEVCREFQRGQCSRSDLECKFAHPAPHVEVQNGRVTACYDSIKGRCQRENPKCKYLHPPQHLKDELLKNGRQNLALKNLLINQFTPATPNPATAMVNPFAVAGANAAYMPGVATYSPYANCFALNTAALYPSLIAASPGDQVIQVGGVMPAVSANSAAAAAVQAQKVARADRIEVCREFLRGSCQRPESDCKFAHPAPEVERLSDGTVTICMDFVRTGGMCGRDNCRYFHPPPHLLASLKSLANRMVISPHAGGGQNGVNTVSPGAMGAALELISQQQQNGQNLSSPAHSVSAVANLSASQAAALTGMIAATNSHLAGKKRPLEDPTDPFLLAAAALQQPNAYKRTALEKSGMPVYQPIPANWQTSQLNAAGLQYQHLAAFPGLQASFLPAMSFTPLSPLGTSSYATSPTVLTQTVSGSQPLTSARLANNIASVAYFDEAGQLLDTLPVCRDFKQGHCERNNCRYVHLLEDFVDVSEGKVTVCRDFAKGKCTRVMCKYYHIPIYSAAATTGNQRSPGQLLSPLGQPGQFLVATGAYHNLQSPIDAATAALIFAARQQQQQQAVAAAQYFQRLSPTPSVSNDFN